MGKNVTIIYASTSGNVEIVMEKIAEILAQKGYIPSLHRSENTDISVINKANLIIFATSTWGHGKVNPFFGKFLKQMKKYDFSGKKAGFFGLGDIRYEPVYFCEGIKAAREVFLKNKGKELYRVQMMNGDPYELLNTIVKRWTLDFIKALEENDK